MRPIRARKARPHVGHMWVGAEVGVEVAQALRSARFLWASAVRLVSDDVWSQWALVANLLRQVGQSRASNAQELRLMSRALRNNT